MTWIYAWQGVLQRKGEFAIILKATAELRERVIAAIKAMHTYETPAVVVLGVVGSDSGHLA